MMKFTVPPALILATWGTNTWWLAGGGDTFGNLSSGGVVIHAPKLTVALLKGPLSARAVPAVVLWVC
ncbi:MAG: hypothetical protein H0T92_11615 [Pyrinomonadaceae bacterium]|nr:hypothetical protein [Pyrinomonadaceae bacterium]